MGCSAAALMAASLLVWLAAADASSIWYGQETSRMIEEWKAKYEGLSSHSYLTVEEIVLGRGVDKSYEEQTRWLFVGWKAKYGKTYKDVGEEECRYAVFKDSRRRIDLARYEGALSGLNSLSDGTREEMLLRYGYGFRMGEESYEEETRQMFAGWKAKYGKTYKDVGEEECRYKLFKAKRRDVVELNAAAGETAYGLNQFGDLTNEEIRARCYGREGGVWNNPEMEGELSARCLAVAGKNYGLERLVMSLVCRCTARELKQSTEVGGSVIPGDEAHMWI